MSQYGKIVHDQNILLTDKQKNSPTMWFTKYMYFYILLLIFQIFHDKDITLMSYHRSWLKSFSSFSKSSLNKTVSLWISANWGLGLDAVSDLKNTMKLVRIAMLDCSLNKGWKCVL